MAEPAASTAAGLGAVAITLTGSILGVHYDAMILALLGGLAALPYLPPSVGLVQRFLPVITSVLFGAIGAPIATAAAGNYVGWVSALGDMQIRMACAFFLGLVANVAIPIGLSIVKRKGDAA